MIHHRPSWLVPLLTVLIVCAGMTAGEWAAERTSAPPHVRPAATGRTLDNTPPTPLEPGAMNYLTALLHPSWRTVAGDAARRAAAIAAATPEPPATTIVAQSVPLVDRAGDAPPREDGAAPGMSAEGSSPAHSLSDVGGFLACVRQHESRGDYTVHEATGASDAAGAYQFLTTTWNSTARYAGRDDLVGVNPADASPADQDAMAAALYEWQGPSPWAGSNCA